ncbi:MAG: flagellar biosynthetic protein FliR [Pseudomonadota bacterium]
MELTTAEITAWIGSFLWPFMRISGMLFAAPIFGTGYTSTRVRVFIAAILAVMVGPQLGPMPVIDPTSPEAFLVGLHQILIGVAMGFVIQLAFAAVIVGGQVMALQMGLGFASMVDPQTGTQVPVVSQVWNVLAMLLFVSMDGHLMIVQVILESFKGIPVGPTGFDRSAWWTLASQGAHVFAGGVLIAIPVVAAVLVVNLGFGIMTRASPQLNIFAVGFPVTMTVGFGVMILTLPTFEERFVDLVAHAFETVRSLFGPQSG